MHIAPPDYDRMFGALADATRRDIVRRAIEGNEGVAELADHYPMSFAAVQKHIAILERAHLITKERIGRRKVVRTNLEGLLVARSLLDRYEELWQGRIDRMAGDGHGGRPEGGCRPDRRHPRGGHCTIALTGALRTTTRS
jgi:DNA-binding transcriptional ArsR family regulator